MMTMTHQPKEKVMVKKSPTPKRPRGRPRTASPKVKTSLSLPPDLWTAVRIRALQDGMDAQDLVARALEAYLQAAKPAPKGGQS